MEFILITVVIFVILIVVAAKKQRAAEEEQKNNREPEKDLKTLINTEVLPCRWVQKFKNCDMDWEWSLIYDYRDPAQNGNCIAHRIAYVEAIAPSGTLQLKFIDDSRMLPEVRNHYINMFTQQFPFWAEPHPERITAKQDRWRADPEEIARREAADAAALAAYQAKLAAQPKCPNCHSTNIRPISLGKRIVSTELLGVASPTIGKSYECLNCKYKW